MNYNISMFETAKRVTALFLTFFMITALSGCKSNKPPPKVINTSSVEVTVSAIADTSETVIITNTGKKYHSRVHGNMQSQYEVTADHARKLRLEPCKVCYGEENL